MFRLVIMTYCLLVAVIVDCSSDFSAGRDDTNAPNKGDFTNVCMYPKCPFLCQHTVCEKTDVMDRDLFLPFNLILCLSLSVLFVSVG